jgi:uncharacterized protein YfaS (alpha-2-macroglobulin family)
VFADLLARVFGRFDWQAPGWWGAIARRVTRFGVWCRSNRPRAAALALALLTFGAAILGGVWWWKTRPKPQYVSVQVGAPAATDLNADTPTFNALFLTFGESVAPLASIGKRVVDGIALSPAYAGTWTWADERTLRFDPKQDWPVGQKFAARIDRKKLLRENVALESDVIEFSSAPFRAEFDKYEFYQDPTEPATKKIVVTVRFSHAVDPRTFDDRFKLRWKGKPAGAFGFGERTLPFRVTYDSKGIAAYVHSEPLTLAEEAAEIEVIVERGVRAQRGGDELSSELMASVRVPGRFSLAVQDAGLAFVNNEQFETEQLLNVEMSEGVGATELRGKLKAYLLPVRHPDQRKDDPNPYQWNSPAQVAPEILPLAQALPLTALEGTTDYPALHAFKYRADPGRFIYLTIDKGVRSFGALELGKRFDTTLLVPPLPQEVKILHSGALLSLKGERKVSLYSRDVPAIRYEVGRVLPERLHLLVSQTSGDLPNPSFNGWSLDFDDLSERETVVEPAERLPNGRVQYHGFDLSPYLTRDSGRTGIFLITADGWDPVQKTTLGSQDRRLVLLTDLGIIAKRAVDGTEAVFVQSIGSGEPVPGATVQVLGRNGLPVVTRTTDERGFAALPALADYTRERAPLVYVVRKDDDTSILPYARGERGTDLSRFDVGGVSNAVEGGALSAFVFSDRGIYRPGDLLRAGLIVKAADWAKSIAGVPLEVIVSDPRGTTVARERIKLSAGGLEEIRYQTSESSPTGVYNVSVHIIDRNAVAARIGSTSVNVQEFLPDRMKLAVRFTSESEQGWVSPDKLAANAQLSTLFDTPAAGRRVSATLTLSPRVPQFARYADYQFADPSRAKRSHRDALADATTNDAGEAALPLNLERFDAGTYWLQIVVQGFEPTGGRGVTAERSVLVSPAPYLVGLKADGELGYINQNAVRSVDVLAIDAKLEPTNPNDLKVGLVERRWISVLERHRDGTLKYVSRLKETPVNEQPLALASGRAQRVLATDRPGEFALVVRDAKGRELNRMQYSVAGQANVARNLDRNAELEIKLARTDVAPGEEIELSIKAPYTGAGLIAIERERVHAFRWFKTDTTASVQRIALPGGFEGTGYVTVTFVRDSNSPEVFMSPLSYGVAPFAANLDRRRLDVALDAPALVKPGDTLAVKYSTNKPSRIVVFGVDEGILQVAGYKTPDPLQYFFEKRALEVDTRQILDLILPEFRQLMQAAPGGDAEGGMAKFLNPFKRKRDAPAVFWSGVLDADATQRTFNYTVPEYFNGSMRLMAVAVTPDGVGAMARSAVVRGDFVILPNAPLAVAPGDEFTLTAGITNNVNGSGAAAQIATALTASDHFELVGAPQVVTAIDERREGIVKFTLRAKQKLGSGSLTLRSSLGNKSGRLTSAVSVRPAAAFASVVTVGSIDAKKSLPVPRNLYPERRELSAAASFHPLVLASGLEAYLEQYPFGCTEQLVSQAMPAVVLGKRPELGLSNAPRAPDAYRRLLTELRARQNADGSFSYWPGDSSPSAYPSVYALHFLIEAQARGMPAANDVLERGGEWLTQFASGSGQTLGEERARAYAIYLLTRLGRVASNYANAQVERLDATYQKAWRRDVAAAYLAAAYRNMRQGRLARDLIGGVSFSTQPNTWKIDYADRAGDFYYTELTHNAQLLYFLAKHFPERIRERAAESILAVARSASAEHNTLSAAYVVLSLDAYADAVVTRPAGSLGVTETLRSKATRALALSNGLVRRAAFSPDATAVTFSADGDMPAFFAVTQAGFDRTLPTEPLKRGLEVFREFYDANNKLVTSVKQGDEVLVRVKFRSTDMRSYWDGVVVDMLPGGFEPILEDLIRAPAAAQSDAACVGEEEGGEDCVEVYAPQGNQTAQLGSWRAEHVDVREERIIAFGPITPEVGELVYRVRATTAGTFVVPPAQVESMYDAQARGRSVGSKITVMPRQ